MFSENLKYLAPSSNPYKAEMSYGQKHLTQCHLMTGILRIYSLKKKQGYIHLRTYYSTVTPFIFDLKYLEQ